MNSTTRKGELSKFASSGAGIGEATVHALVRRGARVLIIDVNDDDGEALVILHGPKAMYIHCEVTCALASSKESDSD